MNHQVNVYYMYCPKRQERAADYRKYQKKLEEHILQWGLKDMFSVCGSAKNIAAGTYGKPYLKGMEQYHYNMSNTDGMVVCALSDIEVGVDVERKKPFSRHILQKCVTDSEKTYILDSATKEQEERFFRIWTLKESYIKMTGEGMRFPLQEISFEIHSDSSRQAGTVKCNREGAFYQRFQGEYLISLCVQETSDVQWIELKNNLE